MANEQRDLTHQDRVQAFRDAISGIRIAAHLLIENELWGALDETARLLDRLENQYELFRTLDPCSESLVSLARPRRGRKSGVPVVPEAIRRARLEAGLSQVDVAGQDVTRAQICQIEKGRARPSMRVLQLIAARTRKPVAFFLAEVER